jgi:ATP-dependent DNA helicase
MTEAANKRLKAAEKKSKKRKSKGEVSASKKKKKIESEAALKTAQDKHAKIRSGSKPIFMQPENLAEGCLLKDYQLVGVRWLASLFENGVSGILADGKKRFVTYQDLVVIERSG